MRLIAKLRARVAKALRKLRFRNDNTTMQLKVANELTSVLGKGFTSVEHDFQRGRKS